MPVSKGAGRAVSCADCYFHQELLCALPGDRVCPTFRATVGRRPAQPLQAQLMPLPTRAQLDDAVMPVPRVMPAPARIPTPQQQPAAVVAARQAAPFSETAQESRFTIRDAHEIATPAQDPNIVPVRVAAARVDFDNELVVPAHSPTPSPTEYLAGPSAPRERVGLRGFSASRSHRIAERIAARYPNSTPIHA
jgi:hypothetical protein